MRWREGLGAHRVFRECVHTVCLCLFVSVCVCAPGATSSGNERGSERASFVDDSSSGKSV
jgi:hypothetical protein